MNKKTTSKSNFTLMELVAVISILSILLTMTINIMTIDSTKSNALIVGSSLNYAKQYAMTAIDDKYVVEVEVLANSISIHMVNIEDMSSKLIKSDVLMSDSSVRSGVGTYTFNRSGVPDIDSTITFTVVSNKSDDGSNSIDVKLRPFTGKVIYY